MEDYMLRPPVGIAIIGFFALVAGISHLFLGLNLVGAVTFGPAQTGSGIFLSGVLAIIGGAIFIAVAFALWSLQPWAWAFAMIIAVLGLFEAFLILLASASLGYGLAAALLPAVVLWYLNQPEIKGTFVEGVEG
jgi:hypothetical protein